MSLKESLARSKAKWKRRLHIVSKDASSVSTPMDVPVVPTGALPSPASQPQLSVVTLGPVLSPHENDDQSRPTPQTDHRSGKSGMAWSGVKTLLEVLEASADAFGPLKSAVGGLNKCIKIYEKNASKGRKDYAELHEKLDGLLSDLAEHVKQPMSFEMTNSVNRLCYGIKAELKIVEEKQAQNKVEQLVIAMEVSDEILECYRRIHGHLERLTLNANMSILKDMDKLKMRALLSGLSPVKSAIYNSTESDDIKRGGCTRGTREPQIDLLLEWARNPDTGRTCWVNGMAGTGKTTIAYSVCSRLDATCELGASFFCSRVIPKCGQVKYIIPSIAYQLAGFSLPFRSALAKVLESDPDAHARALKIQYQQLIVRPLLEVQGSLPADFIIVIDAMDECENENSLSQVLALLLSPSDTLPIRFLISSRPEMEINRQMMDRVGKQGDALLVLHDLDSSSVKADIEVYIRRELEDIPLTDAQWSDIIERCGVLFIYASTTCRYLQEAHKMETLDQAVSTITASATEPMEPGDESAIDELYFTILETAFKRTGMSQANKRGMQAILEAGLGALDM
ncbi:hypothetical protein FRC11_003394 [Ceratobasidium sp. 423]|nr:hypothetical protein FRC11_003394 [Ceratobasidium sp. 423]